MVIGIALSLVAVGVLIVSLQVVMTYSRYEEIRRDSESDR